MTIRKQTRMIVLSIMLFGLVAAWPSSAQNNNLLTNPGLEGPFVSLNADPAGQSVASGWSAWSVPRTDDAPDFENIAPEYYQAVSSNRIRSGANAQRYESFFATHDGGVFQVVRNVGENVEVTFSAYVYVWSSSLDDEDVSEQDGDVLVQVGIDPTGGTDGTSDNILWSQATERYDAYNQYTISAITESDNVSVWVRSRVGFPVKTSRIYVDDAQLTAVGGDQGESTEEPTDAPTDAPTEEPTDAPTDAPITEPTPTRDSGSVGGPTQPDATTPPPATTAAPIADNFPSTVVHTIQRGDTVSGLATRYGSTVAAIRGANGLNATALIFVGQRLVIPVPLAPSNPAPTQSVVIVTATPVANTGGPTSGGGTYQVQPGDTLSAIARRFNTTVATLAQLNGIVNPNRVLVGQVLSVTDGSVGGPVPQPQPSPTPAPQAYQVQPGDNLYRIALRRGVSLADLIRVNNIVDPNRIFSGQILVIP